MKIFAAAVAAALTAALASGKHLSAKRHGRKLQHADGGLGLFAEAKTGKESDRDGEGGACDGTALQGVWNYMATAGVVAGKGYQVVVTYDAKDDTIGGLFSVYANALSGSFLPLLDDDSSFVRFNDADFHVDDMGECKFVSSQNLTCPFRPLNNNKTLDCQFRVNGTQIDDQNWIVDFPPFETGEPRLIARN